MNSVFQAGDRLPAGWSIVTQLHSSQCIFIVVDEISKVSAQNYLNQQLLKMVGSNTKREELKLAN
ncbi:hypothetical protein I8752_11165 [Nostocaceae cyanobacterium CENA369]|uniref:Uncharacterized protein n=1 Tax=Dendronalium phyllosphericum CENA369 TaxID=1725256 RepID=A0A8J7I4G9_9NOST|nr:hypothetical protein [Dendronalium phyllosphericum]MBH8573563.1 hypothetical protein [Dendronalium phyllosphericum CENA369]